MTKFNIGDIVQLKSGGPQMTISKIITYEENIYRCEWFVNDLRHSGIFSGETLKSFN